MVWGFDSISAALGFCYLLIVTYSCLKKEDTPMNTYSLTPLLRHAVGFDQFDRLIDNLNKIDESKLAYPPYNIEKTGENDYLITLAVAGFAEDDLQLTQERDVLSVRGKISKAEAEQAGRQFLHKGIATRSFERKFNLAEHVKVTGAHLQHGLLQISLQREVPEAAKPRTIAIGTGLDASKSSKKLSVK
jgi:molecular chaperone IbpA